MNYESVKLRKDRVERVLGFKMCHIKKPTLQTAELWRMSLERGCNK